jgi:hypothetical protein
MASFIKIKRSTGTLAPASIQYGELAYTTGVGTHGNGGGKLFIGDNVPNSIAIGGRYYTDLLSIAPGLVAGQTNPTTAANGFVAILDQNRKVDQWNVDNLTLDGNTLSSTNIDGDINIDPNGSGEIVVPDDTFLTFGTSKDTKIKYDEITDDRLEVTGADWNFANGVAISLSDVTESTSTTTGAFTVTGGVGISGNLNVGGTINVDSISGTISTATRALTVDTTTALNNTYYPGLFVSASGTISTSVFVDSGISYNSSTDTLTLTGDLNVNGGDIFTSSTNATVFNTVATTVNAFGSATSVGIGSTAATLTLRPSTVVGVNATQNLYNTVATTVNAFGASTSLNLGASTGTLTLRNPAVVGANSTQNLYNTVATTVNAFGSATSVGIGSTAATLTLRPSTVVGVNATQNLYNTVATNLNFGGSATSLVIGASSGIATINNTTLTLPNATLVNVNGVNPTLASSSSGLLTLFNANLTRVNAFQSAIDVVLSATTGITTIRNKLVVGGNLEVDGNNIQSSTGANVITLSGTNATFVNDITVEGNTNLGNSSADQVTIVGNVYHTGVSTNVGGIFVDAVGISSNIIQTRPGTGDKLYIDPYPDGLSNEGIVIIKGDLQVDGTTTTVNSITVTSNNPIYVVGDNATTRTVMTTVASGSVITIDSVAGINTSDVVSGTNIPSNTIISSINSGTKEITLSNAIIGTIDAGTQLTITQGVDTNDDRGIAFKYISSGIGTEATVKTGFFGYTDSNSRWTYVPDAGIAGNVVTGTKGFLDIKGIYYQAGDFSTNGVNYFDSNGLMKSTVAPGAGISTSNYILTTDASGVPTWTDTIDGGMF